MKRHSIIALAFLAAAALPAAAQSVPDAGLRAEMQGQWADAVNIYQRALEANPAQANLWERIADIRATQLKNPEGAADALREAVKYAPMDARLNYKLSQAYAAIKKGPSALAAIAQAVELDPGNPTYLRARGEIALWTGYYAVAADSFERLLAAAPQDADALLGLARASAPTWNSVRRTRTPCWNTWNWKPSAATQRWCRNTTRCTASASAPARNTGCAWPTSTRWATTLWLLRRR